MRFAFWLFFAASALITLSAPAQGTFVFDQQSSTDETGSILIGYRFQQDQPFGQSFVPSLSSIDFVRLFVDIGGPASPMATVYLNLLSGSITGTVMAATAPLTLDAYFSGRTNFLFPDSVSLTPGTTYYLQPVATVGNPLIAVGSAYAYLQGTLFWKGIPQAPDQLWFREGVVVPEPSAVALIALACVSLWARRRH